MQRINKDKDALCKNISGVKQLKTMEQMAEITGKSPYKKTVMDYKIMPIAMTIQKSRLQKIWLNYLIQSIYVLQF